MKQGNIAIIALVLGIIIAVGGLFYIKSTTNLSKTPTNSVFQTSPTSSSSMNNTSSLTSGTSDADLDTDLKTVDTKLKGVSTAQQDADNSSNDTPIDNGQ